MESYHGKQEPEVVHSFPSGANVDSTHCPMPNGSPTLAGDTIYSVAFHESMPGVQRDRRGLKPITNHPPASYLPFCNSVCTHLGRQETNNYCPFGHELPTWLLYARSAGAVDL